MSTLQALREEERARLLAVLQLCGRITRDTKAAALALSVHGEPRSPSVFALLRDCAALPESVELYEAAHEAVEDRRLNRRGKAGTPRT